MFREIAKFSVRFRWLIIIFWIAMVPVVSSAFPKITDVSHNDTSDFLPKNSPTETASNLEAAFQQEDTATNSILVVNRDNGKLTETDNAAVQQMLGKVKKVKDITEVKDLGISADGQAHE